MSYDLIIDNARLYPMAGDASLSPHRAIAIEAGRIAALGSDADALGDARAYFDACDRVVMPGFIDCHTHAIFAGNRMEEQLMRLQGESYEAIARAGGGIASTVRATRQASGDELVAASLPRIRALMAEGVTTVEIKSGYGLDVDSELRLLRAANQVGDMLPLAVCSTFLGLHAVPAGVSKAAYVALVLERMLPEVIRENLAGCVDIYVERIAFDTSDLERLAQAAQTAGLALRAHTDQLSNMGGTARAAQLGALSCDHLEHSSQQDIDAMAAHGTVAVLLPGAFYFLREQRKPPVEALRAAGVAMAIASDLNPGTSPVASLLTCLHFAVTLFGLRADEALLGVTLNAARALGRQDHIGSIEAGKVADLCVWDLPAPGFLCYQLGGLRPDAVFFRGVHHD